MKLERVQAEEVGLVTIDLQFLAIRNAYFDGQPRTGDGRFSFGKMASFTLHKLHEGWFGVGRGTGQRVNEVYDMLKYAALEHPKITGKVYFYKKGLKHTLGTHDSIELEKLMNSPSIIQATFHKGSCKELKVRPDKSHYADKIWLVHQAVKLDGITNRMDIIVIHNIELDRNVIYDITLHKRQKKAREQKQLS